jgi:hypothetical protein
MAAALPDIAADATADCAYTQRRDLYFDRSTDDVRISALRDLVVNERKC